MAYIFLGIYSISVSASKTQHWLSCNYHATFTLNRKGNSTVTVMSCFSISKSPYWCDLKQTAAWMVEKGKFILFAVKEQNSDNHYLVLYTGCVRLRPQQSSQHTSVWSQSPPPPPCFLSLMSRPDLTTMPSGCSMAEGGLMMPACLGRTKASTCLISALSSSYTHHLPLLL